MWKLRFPMRVRNAAFTSRLRLAVKVRNANKEMKL
jgi:hypothetical protein